MVPDSSLNKEMKSVLGEEESDLMTTVVDEGAEFTPFSITSV